MPRAAIHPDYPDLPFLEVLRGSTEVYRPTGWRQGHFSPEGRWYWNDDFDNPRPIPRNAEEKRRIFLSIFFKYSKLMAFRGAILDFIFTYIPEDTWVKAFSLEDTKEIVDKEEGLIADANWHYMSAVMVELEILDHFPQTPVGFQELLKSFGEVERVKRRLWFRSLVESQSLFADRRLTKTFHIFREQLDFKVLLDPSKPYRLIMANRFVELADHFFIKKVFTLGMDELQVHEKVALQEELRRSTRKL